MKYAELNNLDRFDTYADIKGVYSRGTRGQFDATFRDYVMKEATPEIEALIKEMRKLGYKLSCEHSGTLSWDGTRCMPDTNPTIDTYNDHRMAMAFAPASLTYPNLQIKNPDLVSKSFPEFWTEYSKLC